MSQSLSSSSKVAETQQRHRHRLNSQSSNRQIDQQQKRVKINEIKQKHKQQEKQEYLFEFWFANKSWQHYNSSTIWFVRMIGITYFWVFASFSIQIPTYLSDDGVYPAHALLTDMNMNIASSSFIRRYVYYPTLAWCTSSMWDDDTHTHDDGYDDETIVMMQALGLPLSSSSYKRSVTLTIVTPSILMYILCVTGMCSAMILIFTSSTLCTSSSYHHRILLVLLFIINLSQYTLMHHMHLNHHNHHHRLLIEIGCLAILFQPGRIRRETKLARRWNVIFLIRWTMLRYVLSMGMNHMYSIIASNHSLRTQLSLFLWMDSHHHVNVYMYMACIVCITCIPLFNCIIYNRHVRMCMGIVAFTYSITSYSHSILLFFTASSASILFFDDRTLQFIAQYIPHDMRTHLSLPTSSSIYHHHHHHHRHAQVFQSNASFKRTMRLMCLIGIVMGLMIAIQLQSLSFLSILTFIHISALIMHSLVYILVTLRTLEITIIRASSCMDFFKAFLFLLCTITLYSSSCISHMKSTNMIPNNNNNNNHHHHHHQLSLGKIHHLLTDSWFITNGFGNHQHQRNTRERIIFEGLNDNGDWIQYSNESKRGFINIMEHAPMPHSMKTKTNNVSPFIVNVAQRLLQREPFVEFLFTTIPHAFIDQSPQSIRVMKYVYEISPIPGEMYKLTNSSVYIPPIALRDDTHDMHTFMAPAAIELYKKKTNKMQTYRRKTHKFLIYFMNCGYTILYGTPFNPIIICLALAALSIFGGIFIQAWNRVHARSIKSL